MSQDTTPRGRADDTPGLRYTAALADQIERRWQQRWQADGTYRVPNPGEPGFDASRPKFYCLDMFPYPSGAGLHVGHPEGYTATDIICRYKRMKGFNVLHPMGWDAFGLPAEQYALQTGIHPSITTKKAIDNFRRQLQRFGFCYDWSREFGTIDPEYYKWTQWIFLQIYSAWYDKELDRARPIAELVHELERGMIAVGPSGELVHLAGGGATPAISGEPVGVRMWHELTSEERRIFIDNQRLAYLDEQMVNWCPKLGTALANDEVIDGRSERGGYPVLRKPLRQWIFRITAYAQRLLDDLAKLDWPASTKTMQAEWIGRSEGAEIDFALDLTPFTAPYRGDIATFIRVFTTRPDTVFGATYMVVAPEHPLVDAVMRHPPAGADGPALRAYVEKARNTSEVDRMENRQKTGVFSGVHAVNPATGRPIPVWIADYVLMGYGHGAIMAVPAHDERDFEFAQKFGLPVKDVVYTRVHAAIAYFAGYANPEEQAPERWAGVLADMLGLAVSSNATPEEFPVVLSTIRGRRRPGADGTAIFIDPGAKPGSQPGAVGQRRGSTRIIWLDAIEEMKLTDFEELRRRVAEARITVAGGAAYAGPGFAVNSANDQVSLDGLHTEEAKAEIIKWLESQGAGRRRVNFRLRDWVFSRQRYWGEPFPIVYDAEGRHYPVSESALPVVLPPLDDYHPVESDDPQPLLAKATEWMNTTAGAAGVSPEILPPETPVRREANTMPGSAGSSWYCIRYCDPRNSDVFAGPGAQAYWMGGGPGLRAGAEISGVPGAARSAAVPGPGAGVDLYLGGSEHAVGHLLYSRFWQKVLFDLGHAPVDEPFRKLFHQGLITSFAYQRKDKSIIAVDEVKEESEGKFIEIATGAPVMPVVTKMSKRYKNVINPDDVIGEYGADTFRLYEMYMGPLEASKPWNPRDIIGLFRFLQKTWRLVVDESSGALRVGPAVDPALDKLLHRATAKVAQDIERLAFNTAIAALIEFVNAATSATAAAPGAGGLAREHIERLTLTLAPFAPHMAEEIWSKLGHATSIADAGWPEVDVSKLVDDQVEIPVQVLGKVRSRVVVPAGADAKMIEAAALADEKIKELVAGKPIKKVIVVPGKMVNVVV
ncbi:MAG: leucine--tRNA ligase [Phycisphaerales bacterium]|nr:leucine--tRNA ligase [Phycisphaerales bacterium]